MQRRLMCRILPYNVVVRQASNLKLAPLNGAVLWKPSEKMRVVFHEVLMQARRLQHPQARRPCYFKLPSSQGRALSRGEGAAGPWEKMAGAGPVSRATSLPGG